MSKIIDLVKADLEAREQRGLSKYGTTVDRTDLSIYFFEEPIVFLYL